MKAIDAVAKRLRKNRFLFRNLKTALVGGIAYQEQWAVLQRGIKLYKKPNQTLLLRFTRNQVLIAPLPAISL